MSLNNKYMGIILVCCNAMWNKMTYVKKFNPVYLLYWQDSINISFIIFQILFMSCILSCLYYPGFERFPKSAITQTSNLVSRTSSGKHLESQIMYKNLEQVGTPMNGKRHPDRHIKLYSINLSSIVEGLRTLVVGYGWLILRHYQQYISIIS